jgi:anti-anti-sigma factor
MAMETRSDHGTPIISGTPVISAEGRLDSAHAQVFHDRLDAAARAVVIDMENLSYISSAGLRVIMQAVRKMQRRDARLALCSLSADVRSIFQTSGFDQLVDILPSREAALAAVGP